MAVDGGHIITDDLAHKQIIQSFCLKPLEWLHHTQRRIFNSPCKAYNYTQSLKLC